MYTYESVGFEDGSYYQFTNSSGVPYVILFHFIETSKTLHEHVFNLQLYCYGERPQFDSGTGKTVINVVKEFFESRPDTFVVYYPEEKDGRHECRDGLFSRWFESNHENKYERQMVWANSITDGVKLSIGILYLNSNPDKEQMLSIIKDEIAVKSNNKNNLPY